MMLRILITVLLAFAPVNGIATAAPVRLVSAIVWQMDSEESQEVESAAKPSPQRRTFVPSLYRSLPCPQPGTEYSLLQRPPPAVSVSL